MKQTNTKQQTKVTRTFACTLNHDHGENPLAYREIEALDYFDAMRLAELYWTPELEADASMEGDMYVRVEEIPEGDTARFWISVNNGFAKITLYPGDRLSNVTGGPHEEGYSYTTTTWEHVGDRILRFVYTESCDCDGPLDSWVEGYCDVERLAEIEPTHFDWIPESHYLHNGQAIRLPAWERESARQRDHYAEAMGY